MGIEEEAAAGSSFDAGSALEDLHVDLQRIEALSHAANQALERVPRTDDAEDRRALARLYALVTTTYDVVADALEEADEMVRRLGEVMKERRAGTQPAPAVERPYKRAPAAKAGGRARKAGSPRRRLPLVAEARERAAPAWGLDGEATLAAVERLIDPVARVAG